MEYLGFADWAVIVGYLLGMILLGSWFSREQHTTRDYFLGSRNLPWWSVGFSIIATETSALTFISVPAMAFGGDLTLLQIILGYVIARIVLAAALVPHYFRGEIYSPYELFARSFGPGARRMVAVFFLVAGTLAAGVRVYATSIPLQLILGVNVLLAVLLFIGLSLIYTFLGGIKAVVWTETVQFGLFMLGGLFTLFYIPQFFDGGIKEIWHQASAAGKLHWLNLHFSLQMPFNIWMGIIGGTVHVMSSHGVDQLLVQRVLTCRSVRDGRRALILSAVIIFPLFVIFLLVGVMLWAYYQAHQFVIPLPTTSQGLSKNDYVFPIFMITVMPPVVKGFLIVGILAAAMSSVSAALSALASVSTMDLLRHRLTGGGGESRALWFSRYSTLVWAGALVIVAIASQGVPFIFNMAFKLSGLTSGAMLGGLLLAVFWKRRDGVAVMTGMVVSFAAMVAIYFGTSLAWPWYTLTGALITIGTACACERIRRGRTVTVAR